MKTTFSLARRGAGLGLDLVGGAVGQLRRFGGRSDDESTSPAGRARRAEPSATPRPVSNEPTAPEPAAPAAPAPAARPTRPATTSVTPIASAPDPVTEPAHIEEEPPTLVRSSADPGAEDGVGATIRIDEPWEGYGEMTAPDVVDRLAVADSAQLAAVKLYEGMHRNRRSVLAEADRRLEASVNVR